MEYKNREYPVKKVKLNNSRFTFTRGRFLNKPNLYHYLDYIEMFYEEQNKKKQTH